MFCRGHAGNAKIAYNVLSNVMFPYFRLHRNLDKKIIAEHISMQFLFMIGSCLTHKHRN